MNKPPSKQGHNPAIRSNPSRSRPAHDQESCDKRPRLCGSTSTAESTGSSRRQLPYLALEPQRTWLRRWFFPQQEQLAHRQAFTQSRGHRPKQSVLHLCHRPFCIQPSHLYDGSAKQNSEDRRIELRKGSTWTSSPRNPTSPKQQPSTFGHRLQEAAKSPSDRARGTRCDYIVPAMDRFICPTCGRTTCRTMQNSNSPAHLNRRTTTPISPKSPELPALSGLG